MGRCFQARRFVFGLLLCELACYGQTTTETLACAVRLELPYYQPLTRDARIEGRAEASFTVEAGGSPGRITVEASHELLRQMVESRISKSKFKEDCAGARLTLRVKFTLRPPRMKYGPTEITLVAPDTVEVTTTLPEATIEGTPVPDPEKTIVVK